MKLVLNNEKSKRVNGYENSFDFLGHTFRYSKGLYYPYSKYWNIEPAKKSENKLRGNIKEFLRKNRHKAPDKIINR